MVRLGRCYYRDSSAVPSSWFIICFALLLRHDLFALLLRMACCSVSLSFLFFFFGGFHPSKNIFSNSTLETLQHT